MEERDGCACRCNGARWPAVRMKPQARPPADPDAERKQRSPCHCSVSAHDSSQAHDSTSLPMWAKCAPPPI